MVFVYVILHDHVEQIRYFIIVQRHYSFIAQEVVRAKLENYAIVKQNQGLGSRD